MHQHVGGNVSGGVRVSNNAGTGTWLNSCFMTGFTTCASHRASQLCFVSRTPCFPTCASKTFFQNFKLPLALTLLLFSCGEPTTTAIAPRLRHLRTSIMEAIDDLSMNIIGSHRCTLSICAVFNFTACEQGRTMLRTLLFDHI